MPSPLSGIRVVEIGGRVATAYAGKLLRDAGADVVMLEPPDGHRLRRYHPIGSGPADPVADSPFFAFLAGGKSSAVLAGAATADLLTAADIIILGATPAQAAAIGLDQAEIIRLATSSALVTVSDFGWSGPWTEHPATEFTLQAWCGSTGSRGEPERPPVAVGGDLGEFVAGSYAAFFALATHYGGGRRHVDLSVLEAMTSSMQVFSWLRKGLMLLEVISRTTEVPSVEQAADGYIGISMATAQQWQDFCAMVECPDLADIPDLRFQGGRWVHRDLIRSRTADWFAARTVEEIVELAALFRIPMAAIGNGETLPGMDHFVQRGCFVEHPAGFRQPRSPWLMSEATPLPPALPPALGATGAPWPPRAPGNPSPELPLHGLRVVDLTAFWAGPCATNALAMLGADVVKIESVQRPDGMRFAGGFRPDVEQWSEYSWVFHGVNSGKRSITLDLGSATGKELFGRLVATADVVVENFTPRVMENFGLDYATVKSFNEQIIMVRMPGFGLDGPWRDRVGFAMTMEQLAGPAWLTGYPDGLPTAPRGACDPLAGIHAAFLTIAACEYRRRTGRGQLVEVPMIDVVLNASALQVIEHDTHGTLLTRRGNRGHEFAVQNVYPCAGDEQWIAVSLRDDGDWRAMKDVLGRPDWARHLDYTTESADVIDARLAEWFTRQPLQATVGALVSAGVPAAPVILPPDIIDNPALQARKFFQTVEHPLCGPLPYPRPPITGDFVRSPAPLLGQHNAEILCGALGLSPQELDRLASDAVIGSRPLGL